MTPTEQAARWLADVRAAIGKAIHDPGATEGYKGDRTLSEWQTDAVMRAATAAIARHIAPGDDLVERLNDSWQHSEELCREAAARLSALTAHVAEAREQRGDAEARMETAEAEAATLRDRLARMEKTYWLLRSFATHDDSCKLNKPPKFEGPCSCGLAKALIDGESLAALAKWDAQ